MSKTKRLLAFVLTVLMIVSMLTVVTFAAGTPVFLKDFVDPTGTITKEACLADPALASYKTNDVVVAQVDGTAYEFTYGVNAFATIEAAIEGAEMLSESGEIQILLANASYGDITITKPMSIFGVNWNVNPNTVNPEDPTKPWEKNPEWDNTCSTVSNVVVSGSAIGETNVWGVKITGRLYDHQRPMSSAQTKLTFKNILFSQTAEGTANLVTTTTGRHSAAYAITFYNANSNNQTQSGRYNTDETSLINWRFENLAGTVNRLIDEQVSPKFTMDGCYLDSNMEGFTSQGWWMKWRPYFQDCGFIVKNSCFTNCRNAIYQFEGYVSSAVGDSGGKLPVGCGGEDQYSELIMSGNLLYNVSESDTNTFTINAHSFSKIDLSNNIVISTGIASSELFLNMNFMDASKDYTDIFDLRNNTVVGYSNYGFSYGSSSTKVDTTGSYVCPTYTDSWLSGTSDALPGGNVRFDYCYLDAARTKKSSDIPAFTVNGVTPDTDSMSIELESEAGVLSVVPEVSGLGKYEIYESNADFTNIADYSESNKVEEFTLKNLKNYFLLIAYSYDQVTTVPYKLTINKASASVDPGDLLETTPLAVVERDNLVYNVSLEREMSDFSFKFDDAAVTVEEAVNVTDSISMDKDDNGVYTVTGIEPNETVTIRFLLSANQEQEYFYVIINRGLSKKCEIESAEGVTLDGENLSATVPGDVTEFKFSIKISGGATASVWRGTTVYPMNENGEFSIGGLSSGLNEFTLGVTAENKVDYKLYTLSLNKEKNTEAALYAIEGAVQEGDGFVATARKQFVVNPTVSAGATFKVFADSSCSQLIENNTVTIAGDTTVYIIVTSESGTNVSAPIVLNIKKSDDGISVAGETIDANDPSLHIVKLEDNLKSVNLDISVKNATYQLYADKKLTTTATSQLNLDQGTTYLYAAVVYSDGEKETVTIKVISNRSPVAYKDSASIPGWAKTYIDKLNASGTGVLQGDDLGNFNAANSMTRYEIAAIAVRLLGIDASQYAGVNLAYTDSIAKWAENYVKAVTALGIMGGSEDLSGNLVFDGKGNTTRSQLAKIVVELSFLDNEMTQTVDEYYAANQQAVDSRYNSFDFADEASVQNWAKTYVKLAVYAEYFNGSEIDGRNYISGKDNIKRSEIAAVCTRYLGL